LGSERVLKRVSKDYRINKCWGVLKEIVKKARKVSYGGVFLGLQKEIRNFKRSPSGVASRKGENEIGISVFV